MARGLQVWSQTAASNNTIDSGVNWAEGQAPSSVNDSARAEMASMAMWRDDNNGTIATTGTTLAYTVSTNQGSTGNIDGYTLSVYFHATNDSSATLARDSAPAAPMQLIAGSNLSGGEFQANTTANFKYNSGSTSWLLHGNIAPGSQPNIINTTNLTDSAVTYAKIQSETVGTFLGRATSASSAGAATPPEEITFGAGLLATAATTAASAIISAPAFPPAGVFSNLVIKVASNTTVTASADFATLATSGSSAFQTLPLTGTINFGTSGAVNALDTGTIASGTWYALWGIASSTSTAGGWLASTSFTTPLLPSPYTRKTRLGAVVTSTSTSGQNLMGTWQLGRRAQYIAGLAQTVSSPTIASTATGTYNITSPSLTVTSISKFVPSSASTIRVTALGQNDPCIVAPSAAYSGTNNGPVGSNNLRPQIWLDAGALAITADILLESTNLYIVTQTSARVVVQGWEDNI